MDTQKKSRFQRAVEELSFRDDVVLRAALNNQPEIAKAILSPILGRDDFEIASVNTQVHSESISGHSVIFDAVIVFTSGERVELEVQRDRYMASPQRMRYYASMFDVASLQKGQDYTELPHCVTIFIVEGDVFGKRLPLYRITRRIHECDEEFGDGSEIIVADATHKDETTALGQLMHDLYAKRAEDMHNTVLARGINEVKSKTEDKSMGELWDQLVQEIREEGREEGRKEGKRESVIESLREGIINEEQAAKMLRVDVEEVRRLLAQAE